MTQTSLLLLAIAEYVRAEKLFETAYPDRGQSIQASRASRMK